jgi:hypothetical protein
VYELEENTSAHLYAFSHSLNDLSSSLSRCRDNRGGQGREQGHGDGSAAAVGAKAGLKWWCGFGVGGVSSVLNFPEVCYKYKCHD